MRLRTVIGVVCALGIMMAGTASAATYGTNWGGIHKGKSYFGIDLDAVAGVIAGKSSGKTYFTARGYLDADAELMNKNMDLLYIYAGAGLDTSPKVWSKIQVQLGGVTVENWSQSNSASLSFNKELASIPVFGVSAKKSIKIAGIKLKVEAEAGGTMGISLVGNVNTSGASTSLVPSVTVGASASAKLDVGVAKFGVSGSATIVEVSTPATAYANLNGSSSIKAGYSLSLDWEALSGNLKAWVKVAGKKTKTKLLDFSGWDGSYTLLNQSVTFGI